VPRRRITDKGFLNAPLQKPNRSLSRHALSKFGTVSPIDLEHKDGSSSYVEIVSPRADVARLNGPGKAIVKRSCPANPRLLRPCPSKFDTPEEAREHVRKFHIYVPKQEPTSNCAENPETEACYKPGCP
jgi:hypothetical protein